MTTDVLAANKRQGGLKYQARMQEAIVGTDAGVSPGEARPMHEPMQDDAGEGATRPPERLELLRDVVVFQAKLALDGLLDFLLIPVSFAAAVVSFFEPRRERDAFYRVVAAGARADRWINLFGVGERRAPRAGGGEADEQAGMDVVVSRIEDYLRREYEAGRMPEPARSTIDRVVARLRDDTEGGAHEEDFRDDPPRP
jgi:hypothetical protein